MASISEYTKYDDIPKRSKGRKAWDRFVGEMGVAPLNVSYTPNYDHEFKGWVCEWNIPDPCIKHMGYGGASCHTFYDSKTL